MEDAKLGVKKCPVCKREYPAEDNYCGIDGSPLEQVKSQAAIEKGSGSS